MLKSKELLSSSSSGSDSDGKVEKKVKEEKASCSRKTCEEAEDCRAAPMIRLLDECELRGSRSVGTCIEDYGVWLC
ncbi:hypothetical protein STEG23_003105 [Scotinomys teguina]